MRAFFTQKKDALCPYIMGGLMGFFLAVVSLEPPVPTPPARVAPTRGVTKDLYMRSGCMGYHMCKEGESWASVSNKLEGAWRIIYGPKMGLQ